MSSHIREQALRFGRISALAFLSQLAVTGLSQAGWAVLASIAVGAVETGIRQVWPVMPLPSGTHAAGPQTSTTPPA